MKNQYVGDVNDYLKYGLLRALSAPPLMLGVVWMLTPSDTRRDGQRLSYLADPRRYRSIDGELFDALGSVAASADRTVDAIEQSRLLGAATYVSALLPDDLRGRNEYFELVQSELSVCDLVFFDPDNGLGVMSVSKGRRHSSKYVYWDELASMFRCGPSLIVYQHFPRRPRSEFLTDLATIARAFTGCDSVVAVMTSHVAFLVLMQPSHAELLRDRLDDFAIRVSPSAVALTI